MADEKTKRRAADSLAQMAEIVLPEDSNARGSIFGGRVLALIDKCAAIVAMRHAREEVVTVSLDEVVFLNPVLVGYVLTLEGRLNAAFGSSMEIEVSVHAENPLTGRRTLTTRALITMVAVDRNGRSIKVRDLLVETDDERARVEQARERRRQRLASREDAG